MNRSSLAFIGLAFAASLSGCISSGPSAGEKLHALVPGKRSVARDAAAMLSQSAEVRRWSILRMARRGNPDAAPQIATRLDRSAESVALVRATAAVGLRMLGNRTVIPALVQSMDDPDPLVRADVARAIGELGGSDEIARLLSALEREYHPEVRIAIVGAVGSIARAEGQSQSVSRSALLALAQQLDDSNDSVVFAAHRELSRELTDQYIPPYRRPWEQWLEQAGTSEQP